MKDDDMPELLPCPFCGDKNPSEQWTGDNVHIECMDCHVKGPYGGATFREGYCETEEKALRVAARKWNTRTDTLEQHKEAVRVLRRKLDMILALARESEDDMIAERALKALQSTAHLVGE